MSNLKFPEPAAREIKPSSSRFERFKAYIRQISSFDQLRIVQQGGRGVEAKQIIRRLEKKIEEDAYDVFYTNKELWKSMKIDKWEKLKASCSKGRLSQHSKFKEIIRLTE